MLLRKPRYATVTKAATPNMAAVFTEAVTALPHGLPSCNKPMCAACIRKLRPAANGSGLICPNCRSPFDAAATYAPESVSEFELQSAAPAVSNSSKQQQVQDQGGG